MKWRRNLFRVFLSCFFHFLSLLVAKSNPMKSDKKCFSLLFFLQRAILIQISRDRRNTAIWTWICVCVWLMQYCGMVFVTTKKHFKWFVWFLWKAHDRVREKERKKNPTNHPRAQNVSRLNILWCVCWHYIEIVVLRIFMKCANLNP